MALYGYSGDTHWTGNSVVIIIPNIDKVIVGLI